MTVLETPWGNQWPRTRGPRLGPKAEALRALRPGQKLWDRYVYIGLARDRQYVKLFWECPCGNSRGCTDYRTFLDEPTIHHCKFCWGRTLYQPKKPLVTYLADMPSNHLELFKQWAANHDFILENEILRINTWGPKCLASDLLVQPSWEDIKQSSDIYFYLDLTPLDRVIQKSFAEGLTKNDIAKDLCFTHKNFIVHTAEAFDASLDYETCHLGPYLNKTSSELKKVRHKQLELLSSSLPLGVIPKPLRRA
jgi:hypothetical protein